MKVIYALILASIFALASAAQETALTEQDYVRVEPSPKAGFTYPYYYYVPADLRSTAGKGRRQTILLLPNNTGKVDDDFAVHENDVKKRMSMAGSVSAALKVAVLMPVFPRPASDWQTYTQALDRDSMISDKAEYRRLDLQTVAMIDHMRSRLAKDGVKFDKRILISGFSASGMFANRFTFLHPDRVKAAAIGSPGGWPIAPLETYKDKALRYPIGTADFKTVSGKKLDLRELRRVPLFVFIGDQDTNDSVPFGDSYDAVDRELIDPLLGKTPVERWPVSEALYKQAGLNATFRTYPGVAHTVTMQMRDDIRAFLLRYAH
jgi:predicted esterase